MQSLQFDLTQIVTGIVVGVISFIGWIARKTFTNEKQIAILSTHLTNRDTIRKERDDTVDKQFEILSEDVKKILTEVGSK